MKTLKPILKVAIYAAFFIVLFVGITYGAWLIARFKGTAP